MTHVLAVDQGTSGTKAIVVDESGRVLSIAEIALRPGYLPGGAVEGDPEALYASVVEAGRRCSTWTPPSGIPHYSNSSDWPATYMRRRCTSNAKHSSATSRGQDNDRPVRCSIRRSRCRTVLG